MYPDTLVGCFMIAGCLAIVFAALWIRALYVCRGYRKEARDWYAAYQEVEEERNEADTARAEANRQLLELMSKKIGHEEEIKYLDTLAATNTDRNMALEMHAEMRRWRNAFWEEVVCHTVRALFHEKDGPRDELVMALRAEFDRETEDMIERCKQITSWPGIPVRQANEHHLSEEDQCGPSSSPEDSDSSEAT